MSSCGSSPHSPPAACGDHSEQTATALLLGETSRVQRLSGLHASTPVEV